MPIYSEVMQDDEIIHLLGENVRTILIYGCGGCMNESLAFTHNLPIYVSGNNNQGLVPIPITNEVERIEQMLRKKGYIVYPIIISDGTRIGCMNDSKQASWNRLYSEKARPDCILCVSCPAGRAGIQQLSEGIPVICITRQLGVLSYTFSTTEDGQYKIDRDASTVSPFQLDERIRI